MSDRTSHLAHNVRMRVEKHAGHEDDEPDEPWADASTLWLSVVLEGPSSAATTGHALARASTRAAPHQLPS
jgi:hypothetical protein